MEIWLWPNRFILKEEGVVGQNVDIVLMNHFMKKEQQT